MTVKEMGAARRKLGGLLALSQNRLYGKSALCGSLRANCIANASGFPHIVSFSETSPR
jgi:hypothetical protein